MKIINYDRLDIWNYFNSIHKIDIGQSVQPIKKSKCFILSGNDALLKLLIIMTCSIDYVLAIHDDQERLVSQMDLLRFIYSRKAKCPIISLQMSEILEKKLDADLNFPVSINLNQSCFYGFEKMYMYSQRNIPVLDDDCKVRGCIDLTDLPLKEPKILKKPVNDLLKEQGKHKIPVCSLMCNLDQVIQEFVQNQFRVIYVTDSSQRLIDSLCVTDILYILEKSFLDYS